MTTSYWSKQSTTAPLFPDLEWSRPQNRMQAGKLLTIGGNLHGFSAPAQAFNTAEKAGIGSQRVVLPGAIRKVVDSFLPEADYGPSTPSGSFASRSLDVWLEHAAWSDGVLVAGDLGRNSETAIVLEKFINKYSGQLTLTKDAIDYVTTQPLATLNRDNTTVVVSFAQLQKMASNAKFARAFTFDMDFLRLIELLHEFSKEFNAHIIVKHLMTIFVAVDGQVSTTKLDSNKDMWRVETAAKSSVWWLQHPTNDFQALTTAIL